MKITTNSFCNILSHPIEFIKTQQRTRIVTVALAALATLTVFALAVRSVYRHFTAQPKLDDRPNPLLSDLLIGDSKSKTTTRTTSDEAVTGSSNETGDAMPEGSTDQMSVDQFANIPEKDDSIVDGTSSDDESELSYTSTEECSDFDEEGDFPENDEISLEAKTMLYYATIRAMQPPASLEMEEEQDCEDERNYNEGLGYLEAFNLQAALKCFEKAKGLVEADFMRAMILAMEDRTAAEKLESKKIYETLLDDEIYAANAHYRLGAIYNQSQEIGEGRIKDLLTALDYFKQAIKLFKYSDDTDCQDYEDSCAYVPEVKVRILELFRSLTGNGQPSGSTDTGVTLSPELAIQLGRHFEQIGCYVDATKAFTIAAQVSDDGKYELLEFARKGYHGASSAPPIGVVIGVLEELANRRHVHSLFALALIYGFEKTVANKQKAMEYFQRVLQLGDREKHHQIIEYSNQSIRALEK